MTPLLTLLLLAYVIYLDRRVARLHQQVEALGVGHAPAEPGEWHARETWESAAEPMIAPPELVVAPMPLKEAPEPQPEDPGDTPPSFDAVDADDAAEWTEARPGFSFEEWFGRRLPIWAGGITLAVAGVLIVKLSIDAGLLSPTVRVVMGLLFGALLIGGAELARGFEDRVRDVRVRQALSGAGLASLYASVLIAANVYDLISPLVAMLGIAAITALAMALAIRFGAPSALLGLAGGLAAPALIGSNAPNIPLLSLYLALAVGGLTALSRSQRWAWLGISALVGGFGWGLMLLVTGALDTPSSMSLGLYILLLGVGLPALGLAGNRSEQLQLIAGILGSAQMAALVATGGFAMLNWGLFAAIAIASVWLAAREPALQRLPAVGLAIALLLLGAWTQPTVANFAIVLAGTALIYGTMPLRRLWTDRGGLLDSGQLAAILLGGWLLPMLQFDNGLDRDLPLGLLALGLAAAAAGIAALGWKAVGRRDDARFTMLAVTGGMLGAAAAALLLPEWAVGVAIAALGLALLHVGQEAEDSRLEPFAWTFAVAGLVAFFLPYTVSGNDFGDGVDAVRFALLTILAGLFAWRGGFRHGRIVAEFLAPVLFYGALAPLVDSSLEPFIAPLTLLGLAWAGQRFALGRLVPAMGSATLIVLLWAAWPLQQWAGAAAVSLMGFPVLLPSLPDAAEALRRLLAPAMLAGLATWLALPRLRHRERLAGVAVAAALAAVAIHSLYKQLFGLQTLAYFEVYGMAERTVWQLLLTVAAAIAWRFGRKTVALGLAGAAVGHFALYSLVLHNPLWAVQHVGSWPIVNLLLPAYGLALAWTVAAGRMDFGLPAQRRAISIAQMILILLFAFSTLRQLFHGSLLVAPGLGQAEDIGRSVLAIALAIGFLLWGIVRQERIWRLASLALMLAAVGKVFLLDASGLEGLVRIASFVALGFSLIGIGWLYARHLPSSGPKAVAA